MDTVYSVWLAECFGPASAVPCVLISRYGTAQNVYEHRLSVKDTGLLTRHQNELLQSCSLERATEILTENRNAGISVVGCDEEAYPSRLRVLDDFPAALYYKGDIAVCERKLLIAMIGTRRPSAYGVRVQKFLSEALCKSGTVLVSGLASGLDSEAHKAAIREGIPTVAVIGTGPDLCYPASNRTLKQMIEGCGVVLSEYPMGTVGAKQHFLQRNRLIAGLSDGVCVAEAAAHSGTMSTVRYADQYGRDVFAVPGSIFSPLSVGVNAMLTSGAKPVCTAEDILQEYGISALEETCRAAQQSIQDEERPAFTEAECSVMQVLRDEPQPLPVLCSQLKGMLPAKVLATLTTLELAGYVQQMAGRRFCRTEKLPKETEKEGLLDE